MSLIADGLIYSTVRISVKTSNSEKIGTGFIYKYEENGKFWHFVITNRHVVENAQSGEITFHKGKSIEGKNLLVDKEIFNLKFSSRSFYCSTDPSIDIAIWNISRIFDENSDKMYMITVGNKIIPENEEINSKISKIDDIIFIGYPIGIWDTKNYIPIVRKGITSTPYHYDFEGKPIFLIDASVFPGSSGSPVFVYRQGVDLDETTENRIGEKILFLGILSSRLEITAKGIVKLIDIPSTLEAYVNIKQPINVGVVIKDKAIKEIIKQFFIFAEKI